MFYIPHIRKKFRKDYNLIFEVKKFNRYPTKEKIKLLDLLFSLACFDGNYSNDEDDFIKLVVKMLKLPDTLFKKIKARYVKEKKDFDTFYKFFNQFSGINKKSKNELGEAYKILCIEPDCSNKELKSAYRELVKLHHPDKVAHLGDEYMEKAEVIFLKIQVAYEIISKERN